MIFKTTDEIFNTDNSGLLVSSYLDAPPKEHRLNSQFVPSIYNVKYWEQIFRRKNYISVYAAWSPYVEYYMLVNELFIGTDNSYDTFFGYDAVTKLKFKLQILGIQLKENNIWVDDIDIKNFNHTSSV